MKKSKKSHRPKWKTWKRVLSVVLSTAVTVTSIPIMEAHAANTLPDVGLETYDYTRMESIMQDGKELSYLNNSTGAQKISSPMSFGEMVYLQFALPYNTYYDAKVYDASGNDLDTCTQNIIQSIWMAALNQALPAEEKASPRLSRNSKTLYMKCHIRGPISLPVLD